MVVVRFASHSERSKAEPRNPVMEGVRYAMGFPGFARNDGELLRETTEAAAAPRLRDTLYLRLAASACAPLSESSMRRQCL